MKFNVILCYFIYFFLIILLFSPYTFAPWSAKNPPRQPTDGISRTCTYWIRYNRFTLDNYGTNREKTKNRDYNLDKDASLWAAIYAYRIDGKFDPDELLPEEFCLEFGKKNEKFSFTTLKEEMRTCENWILLYGLRNDTSEYNEIYAGNKFHVKNASISIWAEMYSTYSARTTEVAITPADFCARLGKTVGQGAIPMSFMIRSEIALTCEAWIKLYEYTDDVKFNFNKAKLFQKQEFNLYIQIHYWPKDYAYFLNSASLSYVTENKYVPRNYCLIYNTDLTKTYSLIYAGRSTT